MAEELGKDSDFLQWCSPLANMRCVCGVGNIYEESVHLGSLRRWFMYGVIVRCR